MTDRYEVEVLLRPPVELSSAIVALSCAGIVLAAPHILMMTPSVAVFSAGCLGEVGVWCGRQAWRVIQYQRHLKRSPRYVMSPSQVPVSQSVLLLGRGFRWNQTHTERLYAARDKRAERYLQPSAIKQWVRRKEIEWEHTPLLRTIMRWTALDSPLNPVRPPPAIGGDAVIHGVGIRGEANATMPLNDRVGHMVVIARTRHGKTRLAQVLTTQDIRRGNNCVIVLDPKGDADYLKRIYIESQRAGRQLIIFHLGYPELSARYNAIGSFSRITEVATRIASQLPGEGEASAFKEFAWQFINVIAVALVAMGETPDYLKIRRYITDIDALLILYGRHWLAEHGPEDWQDELGELQDSINIKSLPRIDQSKDPEALAMVRYLNTHASFDQVLEGLMSAFLYDREYFLKITVSIKPFLEKLTTGNIATIPAPDKANTDDQRPVLEWAQAIRSNAVVYVGLDALTDPEVASAVGASMFSDLTSLAGHIYKHGVAPSNANERARKPPDIVIHGDEFSDLNGPQFKTLINKSGGAGCQLNLYTQTWSDPIAELGSEAKAGQLAGNIGTMLIMGVKEVATCEMFTRQLPGVSVSEIMAVSGVTDNVDTSAGIGFTSNNQDRVNISRVPMISPADIVALPKGQAFVLLRGSELWKIRIPMPSKMDDQEAARRFGRHASAYAAQLYVSRGLVQLLQQYEWPIGQGDKPMAKSQQYQPPRRKEPGLIGQLFSALVQLMVWLVISLMLSIIIEWLGMIWFWPEQGADHVKAVLAADQAYLNQQLYDQSLAIRHDVIAMTHEATSWIARQSWLSTLPHNVPDVPDGSFFSSLQRWGYDLYQRFNDYLQASTYVTQTFIIRLALILFSLPIFLVAALVGGVDGLVERDLRRWGGGRESSNVFNLARRSVVPSFVAACVVYISLPFSINPVVVILPFAILLGLAVRIGFERLKKYF